VVRRLVLVLGDQLTTSLSALRAADRERDVVVMAEVLEEAEYVPHHPKKIAFLFAAMRKFAAHLREEGWTVAYTRLEDPGNSNSITGELLGRASEHGAQEVLTTRCGEWRLIERLEALPLELRQLNDDRFISSPGEFADWAEGRKTLRMEFFYREMRRRTGILMDDKGEPEGGKWNYDHENRKPAPEMLDAAGPLEFAPDAEVEEVLELVERRFGGNFGRLRPFAFATDRDQALRALEHFIKHDLPKFGDYQDAMLRDEPFLYHAHISVYMNAGLLGALEVCEAAEAAYRAGDAPLNAVEGFIRQILGWREFMRGIYFLEGPDYTGRNTLDHRRPLPDFYWSAETDMDCVAQAVAATRDHGYAHHIQRLMVTGNLALLIGVDPAEVHEWYLAVYADAYEWVEAPNVIGMSQFADGGLLASKPYVSSGAYINRMSDYCKGCSYSVSRKTGQGACPFNLLYWQFLDRHRERFENNARMGNMYRSWDRMDEARRKTVLTEAEALLARLDAGERI
jgi:deoxyribodipyrimidine photolyase-related protein